MMEKTYNVDIHTDGACSCNPGPMGVGVVLVDTDTKNEKEISEFLGDGTNNRAEFLAAIIGIQSLKHPTKTNNKLAVINNSY